MTVAVNIRILALMGDISATFSNLEAQMAILLAKLIDTSAESIAGSFLAEEFTLARTIDLTRRLARYRFVHDDDTIARIEELCKSVDEVRVQRNLFVHGMWNFDPKILAEGKISVWDMRWKEDKAGKHWSRGRERVFAEEDLGQLRKGIRQLVLAAVALNNQMKPAAMMPHWHGNQIAEQQGGGYSPPAARSSNPVP